MIAIELNDGVARVSLHAPPLNILTRELLRDLRTAVESVRHKDGVRVLLLEAEGRHFSAGASVEEHLPPQHRQLLEDFAATILALYEFPLPVIAAVQGRCLGGAFELVQAADIIVAADGAQFGQPEIQLGVFPPVACALLPRLAGPARAAELLFTGDPIDAQAAHAAGLVARVVAPDALHAEAAALAQRVARHSGAALRMTKRALRVVAPATVRSGVALANHAYNDELMVTHDALEGLQAFVQKRAPQWSHR